MKVLVVASSVYTQSLPKSSITGLAVMVRDIYDEVSKYCDVYLWATQSVLPQETISDTFHILPSGIRNWFKGTRLMDIFRALHHSHCDAKKTKNYLRNLATKRLQHEYFFNIIKDINPDVVSFHDFDDINTELVLYCQQEGIKAVITNHLYIGKAKGCSNYDYARLNETIILNQPQLKVSVISTGMKKRMMEDYPSLKSENIYITLDGTKHITPIVKHSVKEKHIKVFLCIANVMERKNQEQLVRALSLFNDEYRKRFVVYFLGSDPKGLLEQAIERYHCTDVAVYIGKVRPEEMSDYYANAFATITTTLCEGFGLTMIEGYAYGLPAILPSDIDSFDDIYTPRCSIAIQGRKDEDIVNAIMRCLDKEWDANIIKDKARQFSLEKVAKGYIEMYQDIVNLNIN